MSEQESLSGTGPKTSRQIEADEAGMRLDRWFKRHFEDLSHGSLQKLLRTGQIRVDGHRAEASTRLEAGQTIRIPPFLEAPRPRALIRKGHEAALRAMILYEDDDVIALNKPAGLAVQGGTGLKRNLDDMLADLSMDGKTKPKLVHRLDRETSGVLLVARTPFAATKLAEAFRERATRKIYWGATVGVPKPIEGKIEAPLVKRGEVMVVDAEDPDAKRAASLYKLIEIGRLEAGPQIAFVALWPLTGRTHQLRIHLAHIGTPLLGDRLYGEKATFEGLGTGLHLHARRLIIPHPRHGTLDVTAPLGPSLQKTWAFFGFDTKAKTDFSSKEDMI